MSAVKEISASEFQSAVLDAEKPVIVDFWAEWCGPCKIIAPYLDELSEERADDVKIVKVDADENADLTADYGVMSLPTQLFFKDGEKVAELNGAVSRADIEAKIDEVSG